MKTKLTKAAYERYLNATDPGLFIPSKNPGTWIRRHDPIRFAVQFNDWRREREDRQNRP